MISIMIGLGLLVVGVCYAVFVAPILLRAIVMGVSDDPTMKLIQYPKVHALRIFAALFAVIVLPSILFVGGGIIWLIFWGVKHV